MTHAKTSVIRMISVLCLLVTIVLVFSTNLSNGREGVSRVSASEAVMIKRDKWSARIVDVSDLESVKRWARNMCRGFKVEEAARLLETEASISAVAAGLTSNLPEPAEAIARAVCEEELRKANPGIP
jgi:DNA-binding transcriptional regulator YdaS (Cro superfamily)